MAERDLIGRRVIERQSSTLALPWPDRDLVEFKLDTDDTLFPAGASIRVTVGRSWDGGLTWRDAFAVFDGGALATRTAASKGGHYIRIGSPQVRDDSRPDDPLARRLNRPTHVRVGVEPLRGTPRVGIRGDV